ncbi:MAG: hypothetical protein M1511_19750 [Deltaproteobacteria bacterium]|nr:hypothetical protein [Deltaproteobacteria bacterium]
MSSKDFVTVKILSMGAKSGGCATCGGGASNPEFINLLTQKIKELEEALNTSYPGKTKIELVDVKESEEEQKSEAGQLLVTGQYPPPLVLINGDPKFAGYIAVDKIVNEVQKTIGE